VSAEIKGGKNRKKDRCLGLTRINVGEKKRRNGEAIGERQKTARRKKKGKRLNTKVEKGKGKIMGRKKLGSSGGRGSARKRAKNNKRRGAGGGRKGCYRKIYNERSVHLTRCVVNKKDICL